MICYASEDPNFVSYGKATFTLMQMHVPVTVITINSLFLQWNSLTEKPFYCKHSCVSGTKYVAPMNKMATCFCRAKTILLFYANINVKSKNVLRDNFLSLYEP